MRRVRSAVADMVSSIGRDQCARWVGSLRTGRAARGLQLMLKLLTAEHELAQRWTIDL